MTMEELRVLISQFDARDPNTVSPEEMKAAVDDFDKAFEGWTPAQLGTLFFNLGIKMTGTPEGQERLYTTSRMIGKFVHNMLALHQAQKRMN